MILAHIDKRFPILMIITLLFLVLGHIVLVDVLRWTEERSVFLEKSFKFDLMFFVDLIVIISCAIIIIKSKQINEQIAFSAFGVEVIIWQFELFFEDFIPSSLIHVVLILINMFILYQVVLFYKKVPALKKGAFQSKISPIVLFLVVIISFILGILSVYLIAILGK